MLLRQVDPEEWGEVGQHDFILQKSNHKGNAWPVSHGESRMAVSSWLCAQPQLWCEGAQLHHQDSSYLSLLENPDASFIPPNGGMWFKSDALQALWCFFRTDTCCSRPGASKSSTLFGDNENVRGNKEMMGVNSCPATWPVVVYVKEVAGTDFQYSYIHMYINEYSYIP